MGISSKVAVDIPIEKSAKRTGRWIGFGFDGFGLAEVSDGFGRRNTWAVGFHLGKVT